MPEEPTSLTPLPEDDPLVRMLTGALQREAETITPSQDGLQQIRARLDSQRPATRPARSRLTLLVAAAAALLVVAGVELAGQRGGSPAPGPVPPASAGPAPSTTGAAIQTPATSSPSSPTTSGASSSRTSGPASVASLPVYYLGRVAAGYRLFREFHPAPAGTPNTPAGRVQAAVTAALSEPPYDPDYVTLWTQGSKASTTLTPDLITIVLNEAAAGGTSIAGSAGDAPAIQQLIWTATAAAVLPGSPAPGTVRIEAQGPTPDRFGTVSLAQPFHRGIQPGGVDPRAPVWIDSLRQDASVPVGELTVLGEAIGSAAPVSWRLTRAGAVVDSGTLPVGATSGGARGNWSLVLILSRSSAYTLIVTGADGAVDSKDFTATG